MINFLVETWLLSVLADFGFGRRDNFIGGETGARGERPQERSEDTSALLSQLL